MSSSEEIGEKVEHVGQGEPDWKLNLAGLPKNEHSRFQQTGQSLRVVSAPSIGRGVFGFQTLFKAAEQDAVLFVLLVFLGVKLALDLEAAVNHERRAQD